jgi:hypothetical protein
LRQVLPGDPGVQHEQDALQCQPVIQPPAPRMPEPALQLRQQRLDHRTTKIILLGALRFNTNEDKCRKYHKMRL